MEGTQPSAAGGDGAPTAMVAVPGLSGALTQGYTFLGGSGTVSMEASLRLRAKDYAAHDRWLVNLQDVITSNNLELRETITNGAWSGRERSRLRRACSCLRSTAVGL